MPGKTWAAHSAVDPTVTRGNGAMPSHPRNMPEQEHSIKERSHELFVEPTQGAAPRTTKPFPVYLRETPAQPLSPLAIGGSATALQIDTDDADALWTRAVEAGAQVHHELADQFWGERHGQLVDPFGHRWNIARHLRDVPDEEVAAAAGRAFGGS